VTAAILIVDDERNILLTLNQALQLEGYKTELASSAEVALQALQGKPVDAVLLDVKMPDCDGLTALEKIKTIKPDLPVVMMSGHATIETAVKATQLGARDFLEKPISRERLLVALRNALEHRAMAEEIAELRAAVGQFEMVGTSPVMERLYQLIRRIAPSEGRVLITGENGSGKELIARAIHQHSQRRKAPFVKLNCAAVPQELIESELFGHERGAFTGALGVRRGKFELAHQGTLFLDEVGDMLPAMQAKLLRVLQEGEFERVGGTETFKVDVRVIAATNKNLELEIGAGRFREDLYYRLNVVHLHCPPLRERREDIQSLAEAFLREACVKNGKRPMQLSTEAIAALSGYSYPGNVRELRNLVERLAILYDGPRITGNEAAQVLPRAAAATPPPVQVPSVEPVASPPPAEDAPATPHRSGVDRPFREQVQDAEREIILNALAFTRDNVTEAAKLLDLERGHFYKKMKALGLRRGGAGDKESE